MLSLCQKSPSSLFAVTLLAASCSTIVAAESTHSVYVAAWSSDSVVQFGPSGQVLGDLFFFPSGFDGSLGMCLGPNGALYACSELTNQVMKFDPYSRSFIGEFAGPGDSLNSPSGIVFGPDFNNDGHPDAYIANFAADSVTVHDGTNGDFLATFVNPGSGGLNGPDAGLAFGPDGNLYVPSYWTNRVLRYDGTTGAFDGIFVNNGVGGMARPRTILFVESTGTMLVSCESTDRVVEYDADTGALIRILISGIDSPSGLALDFDGTILVSSASQNLVNRYSLQTGAFIEEYIAPGTGGIQAPTFVLPIPDLVCEGDINGDDMVGVDDLLTMLGDWGPCLSCDSDLNGDNFVDVEDLLALLAAWGPC